VTGGVTRSRRNERTANYTPACTHPERRRRQLSTAPGVEQLTDLGLDLDTITQVDRELSNIPKCILVPKPFVSEVYVARSVFHEIDEGQAVRVGRFGGANKRCIRGLKGRQHPMQGSVDVIPLTLIP
jgi:hypothetical protein